MKLTGRAIDLSKKSKAVIPASVERLVRPIVVHDLAVSLCSLGTGLTRKKAKKSIIEYMKEVQRERIRLFGK